MQYGVQQMAFRWLLRVACLWALAGGLTACASGSKAAKEPAWVLNPPPDTAAEFWGVGEGPDPDTATRQALRQVAGRLRVTISATLDSAVTVDRQSVYRTGQTRLQEVVRETEFTGYTVQETVRSPTGVYALVRVDRKAFVRETGARFETQRQRVLAALNPGEPRSAFAHYRALRNALPDIDKAIAYGQLLRVAEARALDAAAFSQMEALRQQALSAATGLTVRIEHETQDADVASLLSEILTQEGFRVKTAVSDALPDAIMRVRVQPRIEPLFDTWNCRLDLSLQWWDERGQNVANRSHSVSGVALDSAMRARQDAVRKLGVLMQSGNVPAALGLTL